MITLNELIAVALGQFVVLAALMFTLLKTVFDKEADVLRARIGLLETQLGTADRAKMEYEGALASLRMMEPQLKKQHAEALLAKDAEKERDLAEANKKIDELLEIQRSVVRFSDVAQSLGADVRKLETTPYPSGSVAIDFPEAYRQALFLAQARTQEVNEQIGRQLTEWIGRVQGKTK